MRITSVLCDENSLPENTHFFFPKLPRGFLGGGAFPKEHVKPEWGMRGQKRPKKDYVVFVLSLSAVCLAPLKVATINEIQKVSISW